MRVPGKVSIAFTSRPYRKFDEAIKKNIVHGSLLVVPVGGRIATSRRCTGNRKVWEDAISLTKTSAVARVTQDGPSMNLSLKRFPSQTGIPMNVRPDGAPIFDAKTRIGACEERIGYTFRDKLLLQSALTHASGAQHRLASNERLEFLGDAIMGAVVCEKLYRMYPDYLEGELTKIKSVVVSRQTCAKISGELGLEEFLILGKGMTTHQSVPPSLLSDVFESLVAAIYLDGGDEGSRDFIERHLIPEIELAAGTDHGGNFKSHLQ